MQNKTSPYPEISVVLCSFNGSVFIQSQIESILSQTYPNFKLIISDDSSTDNTRSILSQYENHPNVQVIYRTERLDYSLNFFETAMSASSEFIAFSDQDDVWLPQKLQKLYEAIGDHYLVYSDSEMIDDRDNKLNRKISDLRRLNNISNPAGFIVSNAVWGHTMMIRKELLRYFHPKPEKMPYDIWLAIKASMITGISYVNEPLTLYRQHDKSVSQISIDNQNQKSRDLRRYEEFAHHLYIIDVLKENNPQNNFYNKLYQLYLKKQSGHYVWPLFFYLLKNEKDIFQFVKKSYLSRVNEIRKMARGIKYKQN